MLKPAWDGEDVALLEKFPDLQFLLRRIFDPAVNTAGGFQRRDIFVAIFLERLECDGAVPFLFAHRQKVFGRIRHQGDVLEKKNVGVASKCGLIWQRRQFLLKLLPKFLERARRAIGCAV